MTDVLQPGYSRCATRCFMTFPYHQELVYHSFFPDEAVKQSQVSCCQLIANCRFSFQLSHRLFGEQFYSFIFAVVSSFNFKFFQFYYVILYLLFKISALSIFLMWHILFTDTESRSHSFTLHLLYYSCYV